MIALDSWFDKGQLFSAVSSRSAGHKLGVQRDGQAPAAKSDLGPKFGELWTVTAVPNVTVVNVTVSATVHVGPSHARLTGPPQS